MNQELEESHRRLRISLLLLNMKMDRLTETQRRTQAEINALKERRDAAMPHMRKAHHETDERLKRLAELVERRIREDRRKINRKRKLEE